MGAKKIARRVFLIGSTAIAGGVAFGTYTVLRPHENPLLTELKDGEASFNPWVKIDSETITLFTPHADLGQGVVASQALLLAEELDLEPGQYVTSFGSPSPAYYNTAMADEAVPFKSYDHSSAAERQRVVMGGVMKVIGLQGTGGSTTIPDSYEKLRYAGASARETLKLAASKSHNVPVDALKTEKGAVILPDGTKIPYQDLAADASRLDPVTDVVLREKSEWKLIGNDTQRIDIVGKSTGTLKYGIDQKQDGMKYAAIRINPRQGGELLSYDANAAKEMRGVDAVLEIPQGVAVVADNTWRAMQAVKAIECEWGDAPYPHEQEEHWASVADSFTEDHLDKVWVDIGNAQAETEGVASLEYRAPYVAHAPLEPLSALILVSDETTNIWVGHQIPGIIESRVANIVGHKSENVKIHNQWIGGSFGHRLEFEFTDIAAEIGKQMPNIPILLTYSREEDFAHDFPRQIAMARAKGKVVEGKIDSFDLNIASVSSTRSQSSRMGMSIPGPDSQIAAGAWNLPYIIPNHRVAAYAVPELAPTSSWRSVGASSNGFFVDCAIDEILISTGVDPLEGRLAMVETDAARAVLDAVRDASAWGTPLGEGRGRGVAFVESFGVPVAEVVEVSATEAGIKIDNVYIALDVGPVIDPVNFDNLVKGGVIWGLGHAMNCEITYKDGMAEQTNYHAFEGMRLHQCPHIEIITVDASGHVRGAGEPPVPPAAPALANAIYAATGQRLREMPFNKFVQFV